MASTLEAQLEATWRRWRRRSAALSSTTSHGISLEAQYELLATGLAVSNAHARELLLATDASEAGASSGAARLLLPVPDAGALEDALRFYHFKLVAVRSLITQVVEVADASEATAFAHQVLGGAVVFDVLLTVLKRQDLAPLHATALGSLQTLVAQCPDQNAAMFEHVIARLGASEPAVDVGDDPELSYDSLCAVLRLLVEHERSVSSSGSIHDRAAWVCRVAIANGAQSPRFLHAATVHLAPALLKRQADASSARKLTEELLRATVEAWERLEADLGSSSSTGKTAKAAQGLLYVVCLLVPHNPQLIARLELQAVIARALTENDPLLRKQGLHILKVAFSHYVIQAEQQATEPAPGAPDLGANSSDTSDRQARKKKKTKTKGKETVTAVALPAWVSVWQQFITGSEVILMHHEQHLIEQVWPHVELLIVSSLVVMANKGDEDGSDVRRDGEWPVRMSFAWTCSLLVRVFRHDNAVVKRLFLSQLMERCVLTWDEWRAQYATEERDGLTHELAVDRVQSFACEDSFRHFVFVSVLRAANDPVLYKNSKRAAFQALLTKFLASFLRFRLELEVFYPLPTGSTHAHKLARVSLLDEYVSAMHDAIFGEDAVAHSPEALQSIAQVFQDKELQVVAKQLTAPGSTGGRSALSLLSTRAIEQLRFVMEVHVLPSFPYAVRVRMLNALSHALTRGFTSAQLLSPTTIARILTVLPSSSLVASRGDALVHIIEWLQRSSIEAQGSSALVSHALQCYLGSKDGDDRERTSDSEMDADGQLRADQLARLMLFTATVTSTTGAHDVVRNEEALNDHTRSQERRSVAYETSLSTLLHSSRIDLATVNARSLMTLVAAFEQQRLEIEHDAREDHAATSAPSFAVSFSASSFYGSSTDDKASKSGALSCQLLFGIAEEIVTHWLDTQTHASAGQDVFSDSDSDFDAQVQLLHSATWVVARMAVYIMDEAADLSFMARLEALCESLASLLDCHGSASSRSLQARTLALQMLAIVSSNAAALDTLNTFQAARLAPLLVDMDMRPTASATTLTTAGMKQRAWCLRELAESKWLVLQNALLASAFVPTETLRRVFDDCLASLSTAGMKPSVLLHMANVLSSALRRLAGPLLAADQDGGVALVSPLLRELWDAYGDCKSKPDALTRAVVSCAFQPAFLLSPRLAKGADSVMRQWLETFLAFGRVHRPNVVFHVTCRLCQVWRATPSAARWFLDEIVELLLYKEPVIDEKEQLALASASDVDCDEKRRGFDGDELQQTTALAADAKSRFVRLVVLSFLDELPIEADAGEGDDLEAGDDDDDDDDQRGARRPGRRLLTTLVLRLLRLNVTPEWQKQHMLNSDGFGKKIRAWQALSVLTPRVATLSLVDTHVAPLLREALPVPQLPAVRFYMEVLAMQLVAQFPRAVMDRCLLPLLRNANLTPQVAATLLLVAGYAVHHALDRLVRGHEADSERDRCAALLEAMLPWVNSSHGHTRVLAQYLLAELLPRYLPYEDGLAAAAASPTAARASRLDARFLRQLTLFLSENKECKRMFRRQTQQLDGLRPQFEGSLLGVLSSAYLNEFHELLPRDERLVFATQFRDVLNELYAQYQREHHAEPPGPSAGESGSRSEDAHVHGESGTDAVAAAATEALASLTLNVQRKIDTHPMLLLDDAVALQQQQQQQQLLGHAASDGSRPRQPVIVCASLVDKVPNLAGLARTCEIFRAQSLAVPSTRVLQEEAFASVSVTADKWMPIEEVRPDLDALLGALRRWKRDGYTLVAVEQTASSHCLSSFRFPDKVVVVLGKEREGVPVEVLQAVDACVEIPQFGVIRSLNVHVSGALLLWEYTQQRMLKG